MNSFLAITMKLIAIAPLSFCLLFLTGLSDTQTPSHGLAMEPAVGGEGYFQWLWGCLDGIERDLPAITRSAEDAAAAYIKDGSGIGAWGQPALVGEFTGRAGGLMRTSRTRDIERADWKGVVLFFPREETLAGDLAEAKELCKGRMVIGFGGSAVQKAAQDAGVEWGAFIENHAAPGGGLFPAEGGTTVVPTDPTADTVALWTWTGEFVGALTRLGKMPVIAQSIMVPGAEERARKYQRLKFHDQAPARVEAGVLGHEYLVELRKCLTAVHDQEMVNIRKVAELAAAKLREGRGVHIFAHGHAIRYLIGIPHDPGFFHQVNRGLFELKDDPGIAGGDFVFCLGYDRIFQGWYFEDATARMRAAGAVMAWSMAQYNQDPDTGPSAVPKDEILVGQHWELGDAVATVPGYDVRILPPSGVIAEAILYMTQAEMLAILGPDWVAGLSRPAESAPAAKP
jgi:hypothetical protein